MRYIRLAVHQDPSVRHPMHQFVVEHDGYSVSRLLQYNVALEAEPAFLFHVDGNPEPYEPALEGTDSVRTYEISRCPDDTFYLYVREAIPDHGRDFVSAFTQPGLVGLMPVEYREDGSVRVTGVGPAEMLQAAVDEMPDGMDVEVLEIGEYDARRLDAGSDLTDRQFEAVLAAVDCGYYETPSEGSVEAVGDRLDCAPGTAAELLRRAERSVMQNVASTGPF